MDATVQDLEAARTIPANAASNDAGGMPKDEDLPSTYSIEYIRSWKKKGEPQ